MRSRGISSFLFPMTLAAALLGVGCGGKAAQPDGAVSDGGTADDSGTVSYTCPPPAPTSCPSPAPRYADVAPIIQRNCVVCHSGLTDIWALTDYHHVADWQDLVRDHVLGCTMPPADAGFQMPTADRVAILTWILCGFPE